MPGGRSAVLDRGDSAMHRTQLLRAWSDDVTLFSDGPHGLTLEQLEQLAAAGVGIDERPVARLDGEGELRTVVFTDGTERACGGLLVPVTLHQRSGLAAALGVDLDEPTPLAHDALVVDAMGFTSVDGIAAAGDVTGAMPAVATSVAAGMRAAAAVVGSLMMPAH
ncbi:MAG: FAD-dependent pyridine nucleotide-disulfide oxidoreductase [Thermoleophilia bacterium]|nr:FAD-dependent pyridine nucleotide-disulfide oxidoreductase [Thermoleophilia bacterium]